jgi:branched-chain amino acid transport system substrate-binding protein
VDTLTHSTAGGRFAVAAAVDHDSHAALVAVRRETARLRLTPAIELEFPPDEPGLATLAARVLAPAPRAVLVLAPAQAGGRLMAAIRTGGFRGALLGGATAARSAFRRAAGQAVEGVMAPLLIEPGAGWQAFSDVYEARWQEPPDAAAACGYDAVRLVAAAVRRAGLNRARLRDAVRELSPWPGVSGLVTWNPLGRNVRKPALGVWRDGHLQP